MFPIKALFTRKKDPALQSGGFVDRLNDMVSADRQAMGDRRGITSVSSKKTGKLIKAVPAGKSVARKSLAPATNSRPPAGAAPGEKPRQKALANEAAQASQKLHNTAKGNAEQSVKTGNSETKSRFDEVSKEVKNAPAAPARPLTATTNEAPSSASPTLVKPSQAKSAAIKPVAATKTLSAAAIEASLENFRVYAKARKLSIAKNKTKGFNNPTTQEAWEAWQESQKQTAAKVEQPLLQKISKLNAMLADMEHKPLSTEDSTVLEDMIVIVRRLSFALHKADSKNTLPKKAMDYLTNKFIVGSAFEEKSGN